MGSSTITGNREEMETTNDSAGGNLILVGFSQHPELELVLSLFVLTFYAITVVGNVTIILLSILDARLHTPMYFFLRNLSVLDLCFTTSIVPQMLVNMWGGNKNISYVGCMVQCWVALALGSTECVLLAVMAVDRYVAVCWPLRYALIMHPKLCHLLAAASWSSGFANSFLQSSMAMVLPKCGNKYVDHFFCELLIVVKLSCVDTRPTESKMFIARLIILGIPVSIILTSYVCIGRAVVNMRSAEGRKKAFGTCASHLMVVSLFYGTIMFLYLQPKDNYSQDQSKALAVLYMILAPTLNPVIYTLRNKDVKKAVRKVMGKEQFILVYYILASKQGLKEAVVSLSLSLGNRKGIHTAPEDEMSEKKEKKISSGESDSESDTKEV
ncbi:PREDICTED: putative olfactory receptor 2W6-like [Elephantulus edwardii]|uniref:putative olfactory receptor 2W6-like n=1 Tax=Elephantulus edwardii TaxID=28737 RepID=UPI0003F05B91|nr:PREDICTED: putative olfactory receptor 2W6-like [Elephantulus edwardii]